MLGQPCRSSQRRKGSPAIRKNAGKPKTACRVGITKGCARHAQRASIMSQMINRGKELIRISPKDPNKLEYSTNDGRSWMTRYSGSTPGRFEDLTDNGKEILATTSKGLYYSTNDGRSWMKRS